MGAAVLEALECENRWIKAWIDWPRDDSEVATTRSMLKWLRGGYYHEVYTNEGSAYTQAYAQAGRVGRAIARHTVGDFLV